MTMNYRNPAYNYLGQINCEIEHPEYGWIPFTCDPNDTGAKFDTSALFAEMQPHASPYAPPAQEELDAMAAGQVRSERAYRLTTEVDPIAGNALRWAGLSDEQRQAWADYRQALLDVPQQSGFPHNVTWPSKPE
jgi:hypothetical protein